MILACMHLTIHSHNGLAGNYNYPLSLSCHLLSLSPPPSFPLFPSLPFPPSLPPSLSLPPSPISLSLSSPQLVHVDIVNLKSTSTMPYRFSPIAPIPSSVDSYHDVFDQDTRLNLTWRCCNDYYYYYYFLLLLLGYWVMIAIQCIRWLWMNY